MIRAVRSGDVSPTTEQARERFDAVAKLRFKAVAPNDPVASFDAGMRRYDPQKEANMAGAALTWALAPHLAFDDRTGDRLNALQIFQEDAGTMAGAGAMVPFVEQHAEAKSTLERLIRRGLTSQDSHQVAYAVDALRLWGDAHPVGIYSPPDQLIDQVVSLVELRLSPGLSYLLGECQRLSCNNRFSPDQMHRIQIALGDLLAETNYSAIDPLSERAGTVSLIRKNAARLASSLQERGYGSAETEAWLKAVLEDALPEVRHALATSEG